MHKSVVVNLRVPEAAKAEWIEAAGGKGSLSDWIRESVEARRRGHVSPMRDELRSLRAEINRLGSTVNQWAHMGHQGRYVDAAAIEQAYADMRAAVARALG